LYDPAKEAARYVDAQSFSCNPLYIVVTEPGESHLAGALRTRYPAARLLAIRYDKELFSESDSLWDGVWRPGTGSEVSSWLFSAIADEHLPLTAFLPWKPSDSIWPSLSAYVWNSIASVIRLQTSVMYTRSAFGKRWLANCVRNAMLAKNVVDLSFPRKPVLLAAAGPSLESIFPFDSTRVYVCSVSSALACLLDRGVRPDLAIATDGGYWALAHLRRIPRDIPLAFPLEAAVPSTVLRENPLVLLDYGSELERVLLGMAGIRAERAARNGTVTGTAASFLLDRFPGPVYASGLDLKPVHERSHARPNAGVSAVESTSIKTKPLSHFLFETGRDSSSLDIYASWFSSRDASFRQRFMRIGNEGKPLDGIRSINLADFRDLCSISAERHDAPLPRVVCPCRPWKDRKELLLSWLRSDAAAFEEIPYSIPNDPLHREILQMVSYTGYVKYLKHARSGGPEAKESAQALANETRAFLTRLASTVERLGEE
jgi:hypothetical protein